MIRRPARCLASTEQTSRPDGVSRLGGRVRQALAAVGLSVSRTSDRELGLLLLVSPPLALIWFPLALMPPLVVIGARVQLARTAARLRVSAIERGLPEVIDLLVLGVGAGLTPIEAIRTAVAWCPEPFGVVFRDVVDRVDAGSPISDALSRGAEQLGAAARPLVTVLIASSEDGASLAPGLVRASDAARRRRRYAAEERARRLPVTMLLPLVLCALPAFTLLTVVPLLASSLAGLRLPGS